MLLMRQPYGRRIASTVCYAHPRWYAQQGYVVVIQDVRGRGTSEGEFDLFVHEAADGADAVAWAAELPGANGAVGMYGFSYQGTAQLLAAGQSGSALRALAPAMIGWNIRNDWAYENDAFCLQSNLSWATQIGAEAARLAGDAEAFTELYAASRALPFNGVRPARPNFIEQHARYTHYGAWLTRCDDEAYWRSMSPAALAADVDLPILFVGGWYDTHLSGTLTAYGHYATAATAPTRLVVGPWAHLPWGRFLAGSDFGPDAVSDIDRLQVGWFDYWLKGRDSGALAAPPVQLFEMGRNSWRGFDCWPVGQASLYLTGDGRASVDERSGRLVEARPDASQTDWLVHDPWRNCGRRRTGELGLRECAMRSRSSATPIMTRSLSRRIARPSASAITRFGFPERDTSTWRMSRMALTIFRTTYSGVLKDNMDYSTAMFDGSGKLAAQGLTLPGHLGSPCGSRSGRARHRSPMRYCRPPAATSARYCAALPAIGPHNFFGDADKIAKNPSPLGDRRCRSWREQSLSSRRDLVRSQKLVAATCWRVGLLGAGLHGRFRSRLFAGESRIRTIGPGKQ